MGRRAKRTLQREQRRAAYHAQWEHHYCLQASKQAELEQAALARWRAELARDYVLRCMQITERVQHGPNELAEGWGALVRVDRKLADNWPRLRHEMRRPDTRKRLRWLVVTSGAHEPHPFALVRSPRTGRVGLCLLQHELDDIGLWRLWRFRLCFVRDEA